MLASNEIICTILKVHCHIHRKTMLAVLKKVVSFSSLYYTRARLCIDKFLYTC